jgi:hypothetical protein
LYPSYPPYAPPVPPAPPRRSGPGLKIALGVLVTLALFCGATDGALFLAGRGSTGVAFVDGDQALVNLLSRRATAVIKHDEAAFLADVATDDPKFVDRQRTEYRNLVTLGLSSFTLTMTRAHDYSQVTDAALTREYGNALREVGVTVKYAVGGVDQAPDAEPWVPTFGLVRGRWLLVAEQGAGAGDRYPFAVGGQPWEARPVVVVKSPHVVAVISKEDREIAPHLLDLAERGVVNAAKVRPDGWPGKVLVTAVSDQKVFDSYFAGSPDKMTQVEAVTIPRYDAVPEWDRAARYALSRVVFNPAMLGRGEEELQHALTHEFTHVAFGPATTSNTPVWLIEGMAEYVAFATEKLPDGFLNRAARQAPGSALPADRSFYDSADNYLRAWLACRLIVQRYGQAKLIALYDWFKGHDSVDGGFRSVLGTSQGAFVAAWQANLQSLRAG